MLNLKEKFQSLKFEKYRFNLLFQDDISIPSYKGALLRGAFGYMLRKIFCVQRQIKLCEDCIMKESCVYSYLFETPNLKKEVYFLSLKTSVPHPFVLEPHLDEKTQYKAGEIFQFDLILIGKAINYLPYVVFAFREIGRKGLGSSHAKYRLDSVSLLKNNKEFTIFDGSTELFKEIPQEDLCSTNDEKTIKGNNLNLNFLTPTRIKEKKDLIVEPQFSNIIKSLLIRLSLLSNFHCDSKIELDLKSLVEKSRSIKINHSNLRWNDWTHFSSRLKEKIILGGFTGNISFNGEIKEWLPLIELGEALHIGNGTSFGLGRYKIDWDY
ncbi:MAG: CRISPR system precrRNA processing endoribonuclease RAMP protein Cas6 [Acidobacteriota bacterium]